MVMAYIVLLQDILPSYLSEYARSTTDRYYWPVQDKQTSPNRYGILTLCVQRRGYNL